MEIKREPFIDCHLPLQEPLLSSYVLLSFLLHDIKEMENTKEEEEEH